MKIINVSEYISHNDILIYFANNKLLTSNENLKEENIKKKENRFKQQKQ